MYVIIFFIYQSVDGHLSHFHILAIVNSVTIVEAVQRECEH